ncbi:MAG: pyrroloquinoline quinone biosynthesis protein PqqB [Hyphomicrobiaceae bacterium]|nr:pyrroloquinoline quinone biosynthesis protein PqqB [Hyphomicrobiaceae bacterium]
MLIKVLGSAAGGGFPQWNCNCRNCADVRRGASGFTARTQSSLAVSSNGRDWVLLNASPDLRQQINATPALGSQASGELRNSPIKAAVLTNGDVDHISGLINLREMQPFLVYGSGRVLSVLSSNSIFKILNAEMVQRRELGLDAPVQLMGPGGDLGLTIEAFAVPGKVALYLEDTSKGADFGTVEGDTIGLKITAPESDKTFYYIPGCADVDARLSDRIRGAALVFFDGTLFTDDEMVKAGLMPKTGKRMGHISMSGSDGSIAAFASLGVERKVYVHINNSNPVLDENSPQRKEAEDAGWEIGYDGMEISL